VSTRRRIRGSTQDDVRRHNLGTILTEVHRHGFRSRALLTAEMGLNRSTIGARVAELTALGAVREERPAGTQNAAGRPSLVVRPADDDLQVVAVDIGVDRVVVALVGDGGMSAQMTAVSLAVERALPVLFLVMNNRAHGTIADLQANNFGRSYGCEFRDRDGNPSSPDFAAFGRACGADGYPVEDPEGLAAALRQAIANRRPAVLDVPMINEPVPTPGHWNINDIYQGVFE
jgi:hypothetical protein